MQGESKILEKFQRGFLIPEQGKKFTQMNFRENALVDVQPNDVLTSVL